MRIIGILWSAVGLVLGALSIWGLLAQTSSGSDLASWLIVIAFAAIASMAGLTLVRGKSNGLILSRIVSVVSLLYTLSWLTLGGVDDAASLAVALAALVILSVSSLVVVRSSSQPNKTMEPTR
jgi:hypothetical protein